MNAVAAANSMMIFMMQKIAARQKPSTNAQPAAHAIAKKTMHKHAATKQHAPHATHHLNKKPAKQTTAQNVTGKPATHYQHRRKNLKTLAS